MEREKEIVQRVLRGHCKGKVSILVRKIFSIFLHAFGFLQFSRKMCLQFPNVKSFSQRTNSLSIKVQASCFKMRPNGSLYDPFLRSYVSLDYRQFYIVIGAVMLFAVE